MSDKSPKKRKPTKKQVRASAAERKRAQRARDKSLGWTQVNVRVGQEHVQAVLDFAASLPDPVPPKDPNQLDWVDESD